LETRRPFCGSEKGLLLKFRRSSPALEDLGDGGHIQDLERFPSEMFSSPLQLRREMGSWQAHHFAQNFAAHLSGLVWGTVPSQKNSFSTKNMSPGTYCLIISKCKMSRCPKWVAMARHRLPMGGNESHGLQEAF